MREESVIMRYILERGGGEKVSWVPMKRVEEEDDKKDENLRGA